MSSASSGNSRSIPVLRVASAARAAEFYGRVLGFRLQWGALDPGSIVDPAYIAMEQGGAVLHLSAHSGDGVFGSVVLIEVDDVDRLHAEFLSRGAEIHLAPTDQTWGQRELYVRDPDGNTVRFCSPLRQAPR